MPTQTVTSDFLPSPRHRAVVLLALLVGLTPDPVSAQGGLLGRVKRRVEDNIGRQAERAVDCIMGDQTCIDKAKAEGKPVKIDSTRTAGGTPGTSGPVTPPASTDGSGAGGDNAVWANFDFVPGTKTFFFEDFRSDAIGNFPRRYEFSDGNIELVTFRDRPWLRFAGTGRMFVPLPAVLPLRYTIEMDYWGEQGECWVYPNGKLSDGYRLEFNAGASGGAVTPNGSAENTQRSDQFGKIHQWRVLVDGNYAKVYVNATRVANVPNFNVERATRIGFYCDASMALGAIRIAESGRKLYDALESDGRVATQGIYFDTGSDQIRPESAPTLKEIAAMLTDHAELRLGIEGHTDNVGVAAANLDLSKRRAAAVKAYLVGTLHVDAARLEASGLGATKPAQPNTTPEGRQTNRRVELVKLP